MLGNFFKQFCRLAFKIIISKKSFRNTIKLLSSLDPDLGPNYLQRLLAEVPADMQKVKKMFIFQEFTFRMMNYQT